MTGLIAGLLRPLSWVVTRLLVLARWVSVTLLALMVAVILAQVVARYVFSAAMPWPEEAARFGMLWLTGLMAPLAYRYGGFVAIDMLERALPARLGAAFGLLLLLASLAVLVYVLPVASAHVQSGCLFRSSALALPFTLEFALPLWPGTALTLCSGDDLTFAFAWGWERIPLALTYASLYVGLQLLILVGAEHVLRALLHLLGAADRAPLPAHTDMVSAE